MQTVGAYYNENDPFAAAWLRELIKQGLIADGHVDERVATGISARVGQLRGYGNAICVPQATAFVETAIEWLDGCR